jgi:hypothetical protein
LFVHRKIPDDMVPWVAVLAPVLTGIIDFNAAAWFGFSLGYEKLMLNGALAFLALLVFSKKD